MKTAELKTKVFEALGSVDLYAKESNSEFVDVDLAEKISTQIMKAIEEYTSHPTLPSDEEIKESLMFNSALQYDNEREYALIGAKWMRTIASARIAEMEGEKQEFRKLARFISALNEDHEYFKSIAGYIKLARKLLLTTTT